jgi:hypothetical protein
MKYNFEECINKLKHEIVSVKREKRPVKAAPVVDKPIKIEDSTPLGEVFNEEPGPEQAPDSTLTREDVQESSLVFSKSWTEECVENWFNTQKLNIKILEELRPCDGKLLKQLFVMSKTAPEFFYHALCSKSALSLRDTAMFASELTALFDNN